LLLPFVLVGGVAFDNGGYDATTWGWSTLVPLVVAGTAFVAGLARRPGRLALGFLGLLVAFSAWTWLSVAWSVDVSQSVLEGERQLVYAAAAAAFLLLERRDVARLLAGLLAAIAVVCVWALCLRAFGGAGSYDVASVSPDATRRLAEPIGYSNGLGVFAAIGAVVAGAVALRARRPLAAALLLVYVPTLYFTYSRGAWLALVAGALAAFALAPPRVPRWVALAAGVAVVVAVAVALVRVGGPAGAVRKFSGAPPTVKAGKQRRLLSLSGSSRAQYWHVAWREYESHPWLGAGAGGFQRGWLRLRPAPLPVLDAHSLYLETLSELGPVGLLLLAAMLAVPLGAALAARTHPLTAAACGGYVAFLVHAAQDWDWELPAVTLAGLVCAAGLLLLAERQPRDVLTGADRAVGGSVAAALSLVALAALAGNEALSVAASSLDADHPKAAAADARWAERLVPWSPDPWRLRGEAQLSQGDLEAARRSFERAVKKDGGDWESWADLALVARGSARTDALAHARRLNPLGQSESTGR
jgi:hypothetical protein